MPLSGELLLAGILLAVLVAATTASALGYALGRAVFGPIRHRIFGCEIHAPGSDIEHRARLNQP